MNHAHRSPSPTSRVALALARLALAALVAGGVWAYAVLIVALFGPVPA